jgi:hypothetical protein
MPVGEALRAAAFEIFEEGFFLLLDEAPAPLGPLRYTMVVAEGERPRAEVGLAVDPGVGRALAAHMLGTEAGEVAEDDVAAAVAEALNVLAGRLLADTMGPAAVLELHPPVAGGTPRGTIATFDTADGALALWYVA